MITQKPITPLNIRPTPALNSSVPYKRLVISFLIAAVAITLLVLYYSLGRATIELTMKPDSSIMESSITVGPTDGLDAKAIIKQVEYSGEQTFPASPSGEKEPKASGEVMLINKSNQGQTLIATTRLLSKDNVLFRLTNTVHVPANGSIAAKVTADQTGDVGLIPPTSFTIPGLKPSLREQIYAESAQAMERAEKPGNKVTDLDFEKARKILSEQLLPPALAKIRESLNDTDRKLSVIYTSDINQGESDTPAETAKEFFKYKITLKVTAAFYDPNELKNKTLAKLQKDRSDGKKILTIEDQSLSLSMTEVNPELTEAQVSVKFLAQVAITDADKAFNKNDLLGRTAKEVQNYFATIPGVVRAEVKLWPFWITSVPTSPDKIELTVKSSQ